MNIKDTTTIFLIIIYIYMISYSDCDNYHYYNNINGNYTTTPLCNSDIKHNDIKKYEVKN